MVTDTITALYRQSRQKHLPAFLRSILPPFPLIFVQPFLGRIVRNIAIKRPGLFRRIGEHKNKLFLIDPVDFPFVMLLRAHPDRPSLKIFRRDNLPSCDARIAGTFLTLLDMVDGRLDGDALFFSRDLSVEGDIEAVVCLRNALDDLEGSVVEDCADLFGPPGRHMLTLLRKIRNHDTEK